MRTKLLALAILVLSIAAIFYYKSNSHKFPQPGDLKNYNVVLVTIDTLRADHLPMYGYTKIRTPNLDRFANESLVFADAIAHVPMTLPSHASILTGLLPPSHGVHDNAGFILNSKVETLAETLKSKGYNTGAFVSAFVLDSQFGLDQGFDIYSDHFTLAEARIDNTDVSRTADETEIEVDSWLQNAHTKPFFLWVHYYDPHDPYTPPEPYKTEYKTAPYDGEIAYTDSVFGRLIDHLHRLQLMDNTIVVVTSDHGESLGEHKEQTHSLFIYDATIHVPLMIHVPKSKPERINAVVSHIDIVPTVLDWLGIPASPNMQGKSLIPVIEEKEQTARAAYSESMFPQLHYGWSPLKALTTGQYKFIDAPNAELYDRSTDKSELNNLIKEKAETAKQMRGQLIQIAQESKVEVAQIDAESEEKLRALGYTGTIVKSTAESLKVDPKDRIELLEAVTRAHRALDQKNYPIVVETTTWILQQEPQMVDAQFLLSSAYLNLNELDKALVEMMKTIQLKPDHTQTLYNLGFFYQLQGNLNEAERWYLQLLKYSPAHFRGTLNLVNVYQKKNQPEKAQKYYSQIVDSYTNAINNAKSNELRSSLLEKLGQASFATGNFDQSEKAYKQALELTPQRPMLHFHLGLLYEQKKELDRAKAEYENALRLIESRGIADQRAEALRQVIVRKLTGTKD
ncbi:MAG TPA: sulfatase-like hydrolase/transferase [Acidobacteriota bacterium]|nr:sulfatase-like hydrolase/transferase [Acidobacteriota bacterium]